MKTRYHVWRRTPHHEMLGAYDRLDDAYDVAERIVAGGEIELIEIWTNDPKGERVAIVRRSGVVREVANVG